MSIIPNQTLAHLRAGEVALGFGVGLVRSVAIAQLARAAGYQWLAIDMEHSAVSISEAGEICQAALSAGVTPVVRVKADALHEGARALDNGAQGVLIPNVRHGAQAEKIVASLRFAPQGRRSWGAGAASFAYAPPPVAQALGEANRETLLAAMIEDREGLANVDEIAAVTGIDVLFVGAFDLSIELGIPGQFHEDAMWAALGEVAAACRRHGKVMGLGGIYDDALTPRAIELGCGFLAGGGDQAFMLSAAAARAKTLAGYAATAKAESPRPAAG